MNKMMDMDLYKPIFVLDIEDIYEYRNPKLVKLIKERYKDRTTHLNKDTI
jgi:predicted protein tyrosine phosphatase